MARIAGIVIPNNKRIEYALTAISGIGLASAQKICDTAKVDRATKAADLTEKQEDALRAEVEKQPTEGDLRRIVNNNIKNLQEIQAYRGIRHKKRLPCRGQHTKNNARTRRGKKVTLGSGRVKESKK